MRVLNFILFSQAGALPQAGIKYTRTSVYTLANLPLIICIVVNLDGSSVVEDSLRQESQVTSVFRRWSLTSKDGGMKISIPTAGRHDSIVG